MNTIELDGKVYDLVPRKTIIEEKQQTFTPHDINSELPYQPESTPDAKNVADINNVLPRIKETLEQQNIKGINKYGASLKENNLSTLDYLKHAFEETIDLAQYLAVAINELEGDANDNL